MEHETPFRLAYVLNDLNNDYSSAILKGALVAAEELKICMAVLGVGTLGSPDQNSYKRNRILSLIDNDDFDGIIFTASSLGSYIGEKKIPGVHYSA